MSDAIMPSAFTESTPKARKNHMCDECGALIPKGQAYWKGSGIWDSEPDTWKAHTACAKFRDDLNKYLQNDIGYHAEECAPFGFMTDYLQNFYDDKPIWRDRWEKLRDGMIRCYGAM